MENLDGVFRRPFLLDGKSGIEWLETNGAGGFASASIIERNDRKYHGLLVTPITGHEGRYHILSAVDASFSHKDGLKTGTNRYPGIHHPCGWKNIESVCLVPYPCWIYSSNGLKVKKEIFMREGESAVWITYTVLEGPPTVQADLKLLYTFRNVHDLTRENNQINSDIAVKDNSFTINPYKGMPASKVELSGEWTQNGTFFWDKNICYDSEKERGLEWVEDRFVPGNLEINIEKDKPFVIRISVGDVQALKAEELCSSYTEHLSLLTNNYKPAVDSIALLKQQSSHFILKNPSGKKSINAGYPWFGEWGRDTMLALPGLTFYSGNTELGVKILCDYISMIKNGLLPNTLGDTQGFTSYNSIDAGLLFCWAVNKLLDFGYGKSSTEKNMLKDTIAPAVAEIVYAFLDNRVPEAGLNDDGLLSSGSVDTQLSWMDATAWGKPVTPRHGYAVELNALWYDALYLHKELCILSGENPAEKVELLLKSLPGLYQGMFFLEEGYLSDTCNENGPDKKIRPNMLFAASSRPGLLTKTQHKAVVKTAEKHLLTEFGMRTLAPSDHEFMAVYSGGPEERDSKYHQGTVWPWPLGIMIESSLNASDDIAQTAVFWSDYIENLLTSHLTRDGWGSVSEVFDGLVPRNGKGCFAQAWSCGEIIRAAELINRVKQNENDK